MNSSTLPETRSESLIGTAVPADMFILLETPQPWSKPALLSEGVPESLRQVVRPLLQTKSKKVRVHLIANEQTPTQRQRRILIFQRPALPVAHPTTPGFGNRLARDYQAWEIQVDTPAAMAPALSSFLAKVPSTQPISQGRTRLLPHQTPRHLMICTHASHHECCGMYGYPFYQAAIAQIQQLGLTQHIHPWQISHIGGHRFAPTLIDFPQGRYYGNLDEASLYSLLKQRGAIAPLLATYRGWSLLPKPVQLLEAELFQRHGWSWLHHPIASRILHQDDANQQFKIELWVASAEQPLCRYTASVRQNKLQKYQLEVPLKSELLQRKTG
ncbi:MAG: sucrase ferredoxin [Cyanobacteria bacterium P01_F01_bin.86]